MYVLKKVWQSFFRENSPSKVGFVRNALARVGKNRHKAMRSPAGFSLGLSILPTKNVYYLEL